MAITVLSLKQPWAELILSGKKIIETRDWNTSFRGKFFIHASKNVDKIALKKFGLSRKSLITGKVIGKANLIRVIEYKNETEWKNDDYRHLAGFIPFNNKKYGFLLESVERVKPFDVKGKLGFFQITFPNKKCQKRLDDFDV